jgi:hypothetical protein
LDNPAGRGCQLRQQPLFCTNEDLVDRLAHFR